MKYESKCQLDLIVGSEARKIDQILFDKERRSLVSTNGAAIAVVPCEVEEQDPEKALLPSGIVKELRIKNRSKGNSQLRCEKDGSLSYEGKNGTGIFHLKDSFYPNWKLIVDKNKERDEEGGFCLNPKLLLELAKALGSEKSVRICHYDDGQIRVIPKESKGFGILMGIREER